MLVITRRIGESIVIDGNIQVTVLAQQGGRIRLGITAPDFVRVDREEIHERRCFEEAAEDLVACPHGQGPIYY
jgi:carbon storage regulator